MANWAELKKTKLYHNSGFSGKKGLLKKKKCSINFKSRLQYCPKGTTNGFSFRTAWGTFLDIYASLLSLLLRDQIGTSVFSILQWASLVAQSVKNLLAVQEIQVWSLGWEELLEKEMATHSSILAWKIPLMEEPGRLQSMGLQRVGYDWATLLSLPLYQWESWSYRLIDRLYCAKYIPHFLDYLGVCHRGISSGSC